MDIASLTWKGHTAWRLRDEVAELIVTPTLGGKIASLRDRRVGREWLWRNPYLPIGPTEGETDYVGRCDFGGWDEILPTVAPCRVAGTPWGEDELTDHGELWRWPWRVEEASPEGLSLTLAAPSLPFQMTRWLHLAGGRLAIEHKIENRTASPLPFVWAAHPLLAVEAGMRIHLPLGAKAVFSGGVGIDQQAGVEFHWPCLPLANGGTLDLAAIRGPLAGQAVKAFVDAPGGVRVSAPDASLRICCEEVTWVGLWMNYGGWSGASTPRYFNLGVEPTTHPCDTLGEAIALDGGQPLPPQGTRSWTVTAILESGL